MQHIFSLLMAGIGVFAFAQAPRLERLEFGSRGLRDIAWFLAFGMYLLGTVAVVSSLMFWVVKL